MLWCVLPLLAFAGEPDPEPDLVQIPVGKSALVQLPAPARAVSVTDEAGVRPHKLSATLWQLQGLKVGSTDVVIVHADHEVEALDLEVLRDVTQLERAIERAVRTEP